MEDKEGVSGSTLLLIRRQLRVSRRVDVSWVCDAVDLAALAASDQRLHRLQQAGQQQHAPGEAGAGERPLHVLHEGGSFAPAHRQLGKVFCGSESAELKSKLSAKQSKYIEQLHRNTLEVFKNALETEMWQVGERESDET